MSLVSVFLDGRCVEVELVGKEACVVKNSRSFVAPNFSGVIFLSPLSLNPV